MIQKHEEKTAAQEKFESGAEHVQQAWEATTEATTKVGEVVKKEAQEAFTSGKKYLGKAVQSFGEAATESYDILRDQAQERAQEYRLKAEQALQEASSKAKDVQCEAENYIRTYPFKSICIALGAGFVLATIFRR
jgi:ElaB/YqjD/DUF883 family membrane-anchored ribosome-binding protein